MLECGEEVPLKFTGRLLLTQNSVVRQVKCEGKIRTFSDTQVLKENIRRREDMRFRKRCFQPVVKGRNCKEGEQPKEAERALGCTWRALGQDGEKYVKENGTDKLFFCLFGQKS